MVSYMNQMTPPTIVTGIVVTVDGRPIDMLDICARDSVLVLLAGRGTWAQFHDVKEDDFSWTPVYFNLLNVRSR